MSSARREGNHSSLRRGRGESRRKFIAQGDRVVVVGFATGRIKATNKTFEDHWVFAISVRNGKLANVREYVDTQALARASEMDASPRL